MKTAEELKAYFENMLYDCEADIDADGNASPMAFSILTTFELLNDGELLRVTAAVPDKHVFAFEARQYAFDNPCYHWINGAYLVCAMRECGWKMVPYTEYDETTARHHDLHNGSGVQIMFAKA